MTSAAGAGATGADHEGSHNGKEEEKHKDTAPQGPEDEGVDNIAGLADILREERGRRVETDNHISSFSISYGKLRQNVSQAGQSEELNSGREDTAPLSPGSIEGSLSVPDDTPSVQGSLQSTPSGNFTPSRASLRAALSPSPHPFERRFQARVSSSSSIPRASSPAFLTVHSRQPSLMSQLTIQSHGSEKGARDHEGERPWEVVRWTKLKKISGQIFSEAGKRAFGRPTYLTVAASIAVGTSKGIILLFDYQQTLKGIIGQGTPAAESGTITSLAISADHSTIAAGHSNGAVFTWEIARPARPFLQIPALDKADIQNRKADAHVSGCAILHVAFLGQRRTALVSADDSGMGFSHLATRGLGAVARTVKTTRILGRYPTVLKSSSATRKPSSVLAFSPLPLGNVERSTDQLGLTALLTPYLLVIVSTTPVAQTQFKLPRGKDIAAHSAMTGCLAWFPAVKLKSATSDADSTTSKTKLLYCWSNVLSVLEVEENGNHDSSNTEKKPDLDFRPRSQWKSEEAIAAVQWLSRSVIAVLTITQRLVVLEDCSMRVADSSDLNPKHIYHQDLFSAQLQPLVDKLEQGDDSLHGVIPDAYHMSFKAYKGRLFLLGMSEVSMGVISNWADRLMALMEAGKAIAAIEQATSYYTGNTDTVTIGLPDDDGRRKTLVKDKLLELLSASLRYIFKEDESDTETDLRSDLQEYASVAFTACLSMDQTSFLFDEVYEWYSDASMQDVFLNTLEPYIVEGKIDVVPPLILKDLMNWYASNDLGLRLQDMICSLQTYTMDIDQVTTICKQHNLYDALIYVWTHGLGDYVTPLIDLMSVIANHGEEHDVSMEPTDSALKLFPYMAYTLTGRQYPDDSELGDHEASKAKASMYGFVFSQRTVKWPKSSGKLIITRSNGSSEPTYPYLHALLHFDAYNFMSMLNEAFEDNFLNGGQDQLANGMSAADLHESFGLTINRQRVVNILLEVMTPPEFELNDTIYLDIFIARNLPKFAQYILLPRSVLHKILLDLCHYPSEDIAEECQLSVEYLLSMYHPSDHQELINLLINANFYRVIKATYHRSKQYAKWIESFFNDPDDREGVFACIGDCLRPSTGLSPRQIREVKEVVVKHGRDLAVINTARTATCLRTYAPDLLEEILDCLDDASQMQYIFLHSIFEPKAQEVDQLKAPERFIEEQRERYVESMCRQEPGRVAGYVGLLKSGDLHLGKVLPTMESSGVIDAAVALLARNGLVRDAMDRLIKHMTMLKTALTGLLSIATESPDASNQEEAVDDLLEALDKYAKLGIWLCQGQTQNAQSQPSLTKQRKMRPEEVTEADLTTEEMLWLDFIDMVVSVSRAITAAASPAPSTEAPSQIATKATDALRTTVQQAFTALLAATTFISPTTPTSATHSATIATTAPTSQDHRFLHILRAFLTRAALTTPTLSDLRKVLSTIFAAYAFEESMLALATAFLAKDVFGRVEEAQRQRSAGWRPRSQLCERCRRRAWGPGAGVEIWEAWRESGEVEVGRRRERWEGRGVGGEGQRRKGKARAVGGRDLEEPVGKDAGNAALPDTLVVFACSHLFHRACLRRALAEAAVKDGNASVGAGAGAGTGGGAGKSSAAGMEGGGVEGEAQVDGGSQVMVSNGLTQGVEGGHERFRCPICQ